CLLSTRCTYVVTEAAADGGQTSADQGGQPRCSADRDTSDEHRHHECRGEDSLGVPVGLERQGDPECEQGQELGPRPQAVDGAVGWHVAKQVQLARPPGARAHAGPPPLLPGWAASCRSSTEPSVTRCPPSMTTRRSASPGAASRS